MLGRRSRKLKRSAYVSPARVRLGSRTGRNGRGPPHCQDACPRSHWSVRSSLRAGTRPLCPPTPEGPRGRIPLALSPNGLRAQAQKGIEGTISVAVRSVLQGHLLTYQCRYRSSRRNLDQFFALPRSWKTCGEILKGCTEDVSIASRSAAERRSDATHSGLERTGAAGRAGSGRNSGHPA